MSDPSQAAAGGTGGHQKDVTCVPGGFQVGKFWGFLSGFARVVRWWYFGALLWEFVHAETLP